MGKILIIGSVGVGKTAMDMEVAEKQRGVSIVEATKVSISIRNTHSLVELPYTGPYKTGKEKRREARKAKRKKSG